MGLTCLLLTSDVTLLEVIRAGFSATNVELEMRADAASAIELLVRRHLDSFVIDCDGVERATDLLAQIRSSRSNKLSVIFSVVNATTSVSKAIEAGADFVLAKPVQEEQLRNLLDVAVPRILSVARVHDPDSVIPPASKSGSEEAVSPNISLCSALAMNSRMEMGSLWPCAKQW